MFHNPAKKGLAQSSMVKTLVHSGAPMTAFWKAEHKDQTASAEPESNKPAQISWQSSGPRKESFWVESGH